MRAHEVVTLEEMKEISEVPSHEMVSHHVHKLVQVISIRPLLFVHTHYWPLLILTIVWFGCHVLGETMHITF